MVTKLVIGELTGDYVETPLNSGYYTFPASAHPEDAIAGLYSPGTLTEDAIAGLYVIPERHVGGSFVFENRSSQNILAYNFNDDSTSLFVEDVSGGFRTATVTCVSTPNSLKAKNKIAELTTTEYGKWVGTVTNVDVSSDQTVTFSLASLESKLDVKRLIPPFVNVKLATIIRRLVRLVGVDLELVVTPSIWGHTEYSTLSANMSVWEWIKNFAVVHGYDIVFNHESSEPKLVLRKRVAVISGTPKVNAGEFLAPNLIDCNITNNATERVERVDYTWKTLTPIIRGEVYPKKDQEYSEVLDTINSGETRVIRLELDAHLTKVYRPATYYYVHNRDYSGTNGVYAVLANDGYNVTPAEWLAKGGSLRTRLTDEPGVIEVIVRGMVDEDKAPYTLAVSSGNNYNSLHITGDGLVYQEHKGSFITPWFGENNNTPNTVSVDNLFFNDYGTTFEHVNRSVSRLVTNLTASLSVENVKNVYVPLLNTNNAGNILNGRIVLANDYFSVGSLSNDSGVLEMSLFNDNRFSDVTSVRGSYTFNDLTPSVSNQPLEDLTIGMLGA